RRLPEPPPVPTAAWMNKPEQTPGKAHSLPQERLSQLLTGSAAQQRGLHVVGNGGVLVLAKSRRAVRSIRLELNRLRSVGLYLSDATYRALLEAAGAATGERL
ncbi:MAG: DUF3368 domain-containing protein, partial [Dehalococcoidia bacterium]